MALTDEQKIARIRLLIGDVEGSPFYPLFTDEQYQEFLDMSGGDIYSAAQMAAVSASFVVSGWSTRERTGDIEVWNSISTQYLKALDYFLRNPKVQIPNGLLPWSASVGSCSKLMNIQVCDHEETCGCTDCNKTGERFSY